MQKKTFKRHLQKEEKNTKYISPDTMAFVIYHIYLNRIRRSSALTEQSAVQQQAKKKSLESVMTLPINICTPRV